VGDEQQRRDAGDGGHARVRAGVDQDPGRRALGEQPRAQRGTQLGERAAEHGGAEDRAEDGHAGGDRRQAPLDTAFGRHPRR
jgi:hypothetical protein